MPQLEISLGAPPLIALLAAGVALLLAWLFYRATLPPVSPFRRRLLLVLRGAALILLVLTILDPVVRLVSTTTAPPALTVLVDNSRSMTVVDRSGDRAAVLRGILQSPVLGELASRATIRVRTFGVAPGELHETLPAPPRLDEDGTDIAAVLAASLGPGNGGAALLLSDGVPTLGMNPIHAAPAASIPLFTVGIGDSSEQRDVVVTHISTNAVAYSGIPVPVDVIIKGTGVGGQRVDVRLMEGGTVLDRQTLQFGEGTREYEVPMSYTPATDGLHSLSVSVSALPDELTTQNNRRTFTIRVRKSKLRILLLAGSPSPDVAVTRQTLAEQSQFDIRSYTQNPSGGFYEGAFLQRDLDSADCLMLLGLPTPSTTPATAEALLSALASRPLPLFFQITRETDWRRLGAWNRFLPFQAEAPTSAESEVSCQATPAESQLPLVTPGSADGTDPWTLLPPVFTTRTAVRARPGTTVLVTAQLTGLAAPAPVLLARSIERRRAMALAAHGIWRWRLMAQRSSATQDFYAAVLRNALLWLTTADETGPVIARPLKPLYAAGETMTFEAQVYDARQQPIEDAEVRIVVEGGNDDSEALFTPRPGGRYSADVGGLFNEGTYRYRATARRGSQVLGADSGKVAVGGTAIEFLNTRMDPDLMRQLAVRTGGAFLLPEEFGRLDSLLAQTPSFVPAVSMTSAEITARTWPWLAALVILLLGAEWFFRKRSGML